MLKKVILILLGLLGLIVGIPLALGGGGVLAVGGKEGSVQSGWHAVSTPTTALVTDASNLGNSNVEVRGTKVSVVVEARNAGRPVFLGIAKAQDVENYLRGAANDEITKINFNPFSMETVRETGSLGTVPAPGSQDFWVAQSSGTSPEITWEVTGDGNYRAVVMNADGTAGINTELSMGVKAPVIFGLGLGLLIAGLVIGLIGLALLIWGIMAKRKKKLPPQAPQSYDQPVAATAAPLAYDPQASSAPPTSLLPSSDPPLGGHPPAGAPRPSSLPPQE